MPLTRSEISRALSDTPLVEGKSWRISTEPWPLSKSQAEELSLVGGYCFEFLAALERLYVRSSQDKKLLRNRDLRAPWIAEYFDRGKPDELLRHAKCEKLSGALPVAIRPDLLITSDGFALTEIDCLPDGVGLTAFINNLYGGAKAGIVGGDSMPELFYKAVAATRPDVAAPFVAIVVGDRFGPYRPELEYVSKILRDKGLRVHCGSTADLLPVGGSLCMDVDGSPEDVDVIVRFWELFDHKDVPCSDIIMKAVEAGQIVVTPPMRPFFDEKLSLSLLHHHLLRDYWEENLSQNALKWLLRCVPRSWVMDTAPLPPGAVLDGPSVGGLHIHDWRQLALASQKERDLVIKISGFDENAWGARGLLLGSDASHDEWERAIEEAIAVTSRSLHVVQEYKKPMRLSHPVCRDDSGEIFEMQGRTRLCPYYFNAVGNVETGGVLATFCPADKKIVHGMRDAVLLPCAVFG
jgi:hypothetical protein